MRHKEQQTALVTTMGTAGIPRRPPTLRLDQIFLKLRARLLRANLPEPVKADTRGTRGTRQFPSTTTTSGTS